MSIIQGNAKQGSTRGFYPKTLEGSLRFNDDDSAYLSWTPSTPTDNDVWTFSCWFKLGEITKWRQLLMVDTNASDVIYFNNVDQIRLVFGGTSVDVTTTAVFRDPSAWYHLVMNYNGSTLKLWINGEELISTAMSGNTKLNNSSYVHYLSGTSKWDGYLAEVHFTDGTAYTADDFGELKNGVWVAKNPSVTYGTNGFYLNFLDDTAVEAFNTVLYKGSNQPASYTGVGFKPDLVWTKDRDAVGNHQLFDSVRGASQRLRTSGTYAEDASGITSFDADGFTENNGYVFVNGNDYVAWCWKAGDSNVSNTDGSITSTVRANQTYGFSVVSYTGTGSQATFGHGLGASPSMFIIKNRNAITPWLVWHKDLPTPATQWLKLETTDSVFTNGDAFGTAPTSSVITVNTFSSTNGSGNNLICYAWAEKTGYSKFGSYTGNGSTTGPSVTGLGFKPAMMIIKRTDVANSWYLVDNTRDTTNPISVELEANNTGVEGTGIDRIDFNSDGFQIKTSGAAYNASGGTYIYAAFADTREAAFWLDQSGNDNDWQPVNLDHNDTVADSPTDNFATFNPLAIAKYNATGFRTLGVFSDGNLTLTTNADNESGTVTFGATSGKYYMEFTSVNLAQRQQIIVYSTDDYRSDTGAVTTSSDGGGNATDRVTWTTGDVIGIAVDMDNNKVWLHKNGDWFGTSDPSTNTGGDTLSAFTGVGVRQDSGSTGNAVISFNAGQQPFKYDPPA